MKKLYILVWWVLLTHNCACAMTNVPTIALSIGRDSLYLPLDWTDKLRNSIDIYMDSANVMNVENVQQQHFVPITQVPKAAGLYDDKHIYTYWSRFAIQNTHATDTLHLILKYNYRHIEHYAYQNAATVPMVGGGRLYTFAVAPNSTTVLYSRFFNSRMYDLNWDFSLGNHAHLELQHGKRLKEDIYILLFNGFFIGALVLMAGISLVNYFLQQQKVYLYYTIYLVGLALLFLRNVEAIYRDYPIKILYGYFPILFEWSEGFLMVIVQISYTLFIVHVLNLKEKSPHLYRFMQWVVAGSLLYLPIDVVLEVFFYQSNYSYPAYGTFRIVSAMTTVYTIWYVWQLHGRVMRFIFWGNGSLLIGIAISLYFSAIVPVQQLTHLVFIQIGAFIEIMCFSTALAYQSRQVELEKQAKIEENNLLLKQLSEQTTLKYRAVEAEMRALKGQMRSHLIFNILNSFKFKLLQHKDLKTAEQVSEFSAFLRLMLAHSRESVVNLMDEINFLKKYIEIEQKYAHNSFQLHWQLNVTDIDLKQVQIPALLLQPFVENAILHGLKDKSTDNALLTVQVSQQNSHLVCVIQDNGKGRHIEKKTNSSLGIQIVEDRISSFNQLYNGNIALKIHDLKEGEAALGTLVQLAFG
jgi:7TM diverse intracellular signalling/Histidine kinase